MNYPVRQSDHSLPPLTLLNFVSSMSEISRINEISRIRQFENWIADNDLHLLTVDLVDYRNYLVNRIPALQPTSVNAHLKTIRGRYRKMMQSDAYRNALLSMASQIMNQTDYQAASSMSDTITIANELEKRIHNRIFSDEILVREITKQDKADEDHGIRLNEHEAGMLLRSPGIDTLRGIRDTALLALMICTGIREHEAIATDVSDLRTHYQGILCLRVRAGKGAKQRLIPYGSLEWCLTYVDHWLNHANIQQGAVFRGFWGDSDSIRPTRLTVRQVNRILDAYPVLINGELKIIHPHDLRRTYARMQFESGMTAEALQQNMGHASFDTTLGYIGNLNADKRMSKATLAQPHHIQVGGNERRTGEK